MEPKRPSLAAGGTSGCANTGHSCMRSGVTEFGREQPVGFQTHMAGKRTSSLGRNLEGFVMGTGGRMSTERSNVIDLARPSPISARCDRVHCTVLTQPRPKFGALVTRVGLPRRKGGATGGHPDRGPCRHSWNPVPEPVAPSGIKVGIGARIFVEDRRKLWCSHAPKL